MTKHIDFFARHIHYIDHLAPIWNKLPDEFRGSFYVPTCLEDYARIHLEAEGVALLDPQPEKDVISVSPPAGDNPILTCAYGDMMKTHRSNPERALILMQHGVGLTFGTAAYADGYGGNRHVDMLLMPSQYVADKIPGEITASRAVIGVPKLDGWFGEFEKPHEMPKAPTIAIAFHHGDQSVIPPEAGSAQAHYGRIIPELAKHFHIIGHAHPLARARDMEMFKRAGIEFIPDFSEVMRLADIYINDASSTAYEFLVTGKPVILLNAPWFRKSKSFGLRFWDYSNIGPQVDYPRQLIDTIEQVISYPDALRDERQAAVETLYPYLGSAADRSVEVLCKYLTDGRHAFVSLPAPKQPEKSIHPLTTIENKSRGLLYMAFGERARTELYKSIKTLRRSGCKLPVAVIGDAPVDDAYFIEWTGECPFDNNQPKNFQFRAGRVKPKFYELSPFERTLYLDCDTEFVCSPVKGFGFLNNWDFAIAQERLSISQLYNDKNVNWAHNLTERDLTVSEYGGDGNFPFVNSGLFFFRRGAVVQDLFERWYTEWMRIQDWDEQKALMRAMNKGSARILVLSESWNCPHRDKKEFIMDGPKVVFHAYGQGLARTTKTD